MDCNDLHTNFAHSYKSIVWCSK